MNNMDYPLQRTAEWFEARLGKVTASRVADVLAKTKSGPSAYRTNLMDELIAERLTGKPTNTFVSPAMAWGIEWEDAARQAYIEATGADVEEVGLIDHPTIPMSGASPDGLVGDDICLEIKCPDSKTHIRTLLSHQIPSKHFPQLAFQQVCTGRRRSDFVSFDPRMPLDLQLIIYSYIRDDKYAEMIEEEVRLFLAEIESTMQHIWEITQP